MAKEDGQVEIVESGDVFFLYRPKVEHEKAEGPEDVERFDMVLKPENRDLYRLIVIGRKRLPEIDDHERNWGFVETVTYAAEQMKDELHEKHYETKTRGERTRPAARPAGEGVYAFVRKGRNGYFVYALELPKAPGPVQRSLEIAPEGSFAVAIKNPDREGPSSAGLDEQREARYPPEKQAEFGNRRFVPVDPALLDYEGAEFVMIGARHDPERAYGIELETEPETLDTAEIVRTLRLKRKENPVEPLLTGGWA